MGLREILDTVGGGPVSWRFVGDHLRDHYVRDPHEIDRINEAKKRDAYYDGGGDEYIKQLIYRAFEDPLTRKLRADLVAWAKWNNVLRRVTVEIATVYSEPAKRYVSEGNDTYQALNDLANIDGAMREVDAMLGRHAECWVQYRVRRDTSEPVFDVISPAQFWAIAHPADPGQLVGVLINQTPRNATALTPCYRVITADETFQLDGKCQVIPSTWRPLEFGRMPGVLASLVPPTAKGRLMSQSPASDLVAAHESIWFQNVLLLKESKSANKQAYLSGDTSAATVGQSSDTEREVLLPEGVTVQVVDRGMDLVMFRDNADHVLERAAANHGLPPAVLHQRDASSGAEIHLRRIPLRELRKKRIPVMRRIERELARIQSAVNAADLPAYAFSVDGWGIDFGEVQQPLTESELDQVFEKRRQLGLTTTIEEITKRNPDMTDDQAEEFLRTNIETETRRIVFLRGMQALSGSMGASTEDIVQRDGETPFEANRGEPVQ